MSRRDGAPPADLAIRQTLAAARDASNLLAPDDLPGLLASCDLVERTVRSLPAAEGVIVPMDPRAPVSMTLHVAVVPWPTWPQFRRLSVAFGHDSPQLERLRRDAGGRVVRDEPGGARVFVPNDEFDVRMVERRRPGDRRRSPTNKENQDGK